MRWLFAAMIRWYQRWLSPWMGNQCRFYPTCSEYALSALRQHGSIRGGLLAVGRILRCQPWCEGGFDTVPAQWHVRWICRCHRLGHGDAADDR